MRRCEEPGCAIRLRRDQLGDRCNHHLRATSSQDEEYAAALWRATDASLRQDPSRWRWTSATETETTTRGRAGTEDAVSPYRERDPSAVQRGQQSWENRRAREAAQQRETET